MIGIGESYLALFILAAGLGQVFSGLALTIPVLIGAGLQLFSLSGARAVGGIRRWTVLSAAVQAVAWVPLAVAAFVGVVPAWLVLLAVAMYQAGGLAAGATWTTWIGQIVPERVRSRYFARRAWPCHMGTLVAIVGGGLLLHSQVGSAALDRDAQGGEPIDGLAWFGALFVMAMLARGVSAFFLSVKSCTESPAIRHVHVHPAKFLGRLWSSPDGRLIATMMLMTGAANIANPFWPAFLKEQLDLSYAQVMMLMATNLTSKAFAQVMWGEVAARIGAWRVLLIGGAMVVPLTGLWMVPGGFWWLMGVQVLAGSAWAAWELATLLLALRLVPERERTSLWAQFNLGNALLVAAGSSLGAVLLHHGERAPAWLAALGVGPFAMAFVVSIAGRLGVVLWLLRSSRLLPRGVRA